MCTSIQSQHEAYLEITLQFQEWRGLTATAAAKEPWGPKRGRRCGGLPPSCTPCELGGFAPQTPLISGRLHPPDPLKEPWAPLGNPTFRLPIPLFGMNRRLFPLCGPLRGRYMVNTCRSNVVTQLRAIQNDVET